MIVAKEITQEFAAGPFSQISEMGHENVVFCYDEATGLKSIIGIHSTVLGPALGGLRIWNYKNEQEALTDVLRLSRGMSYKNAVSGLNLGGGKAVIIGDSRTVKTPALLKKFAESIHRLGGAYITAEDVGVSSADIEIMAGITPHIAGKPMKMGGGGDPSPFTAYGVYMGMKAAAHKAFGTDSLAGKRVAVQGCGSVGSRLVKLLAAEGAEIFVTDYFADKAKEMAQEFNATVVGLDEIFDLDVDIFAPCALGGAINDDTIMRLKCHVVAGAANNQLADETRHGYALQDRGIIYAPDFLINAGGVMNVYQEVLGYDEKKAQAMVDTIYDSTLNILNLAEEKHISTHAAAVELAERRLKRN